MGGLRHRGRDRGVDLWWLPDGSRFAGTKEEAEIAAGLRGPAQQSPEATAEEQAAAKAEADAKKAEAEAKKKAEADAKKAGKDSPPDPAAEAAAKAKAEAESGKKQGA